MRQFSSQPLANISVLDEKSGPLCEKKCTLHLVG